MTYDENEIHAAALCAWKEARGEGEEGMLAVLCVIRNRVGQPGFGHTLYDVVFGKDQFSSMSVSTDPEFNLQPVEGDESFTYAYNTAQVIFSTLSGDPTNGALYYANLHVIPKDGWFYRKIVLSPEHPIKAQINHHTFFA